MDTVHPVGNFPGGAFSLRSGCVYGPGVHDCKGGLVIALYVIRALQYAGYDRRQLRLVLVSDEETAHTLSAKKSVEFLQEQSAGCGAAFTFESGLPGGDVVTDHCEVSVALRFHTNQECTDALERLHALCDQVETPGTHCTLGPLVGFPAMEETPRTEALFQVYRQASAALGLGEPGTVFSAGCSDSAYTASMGIPTLCAVGVLGEGQHSLNEHAFPDSLLTQAKRLAAAILALPEDF